MNRLNIIFAGTPEFGVPVLNQLIQSQHRIVAVYTQPDRPAGRGQKLQPSPVKEWALLHGIPVFQPVHFKSQESIQQLKELNPDVMVVIAYGLILPKAVLETPKYGCINVHASLLPRWRGASPIQQAILHGDVETGVTIMQMDEGLDTGNMLCKERCSIEKEDTAGSLHDKLAQISAKPLLDALNSLHQPTIHPEVQNNALATYAGKIKKDDAKINWKSSAVDIDRMIRAYNPWPVAYCQLGHDFLRVLHAKPVHYESDYPPGTIVSIDKKGMLVATGLDALLIEKIQFPGSKVISIADYLNSGKKQIHEGFILE